MLDQIPIKVWKSSTLSSKWFERRTLNQEKNQKIASAVKEIINQVAKNGDAALLKLTEKYDKACLKAKDIRVKTKEIKESYRLVKKEQINALRFIKERISILEKRTLKQAMSITSREGIKVHNVLKPIESVGCYAPGGQAVYPSTLIMTVVPAKEAGVSRIVVCSPPMANCKINPLILVAADICGVDEVYKVGGAQAIAALAYGTETIKPVRKIVGPGNKYVTTAKLIISASKDVAIDMPAGPSEILVLADRTANPKLVAIDMISQAEHSSDSVAGLITTSTKLATEVQSEISEMVVSMNRGEIVAKALKNWGFIITCGSIDEAVELANVFSAEHVEIMAQAAKEIAGRIKTAGLILLGSYSPVALSDYGGETNHVLPTGGFGYTFSGLSALDFARRVSVVEGSKEGLLNLRKHVKIMTDAENLPNHYKAIEARLKNE